MAAVMVAGVSGPLLAVNAIGWPVAGVGFGLLSILWVAFTLQGVRLARAGQYSAHRRWMIRSFALTFAAGLLKI